MGEVRPETRPSDLTSNAINTTAMLPHSYLKLLNQKLVSLDNLDGNLLQGILSQIPTFSNNFFLFIVPDSGSLL